MDLFSFRGTCDEGHAPFGKQLDSRARRAWKICGKICVFNRAAHTNVGVSEWMPSFRGYIYRGSLFLFFFSPSSFPERVSRRVPADCDSPLTYIAHTRKRSGRRRVGGSLDRVFAPFNLTWISHAYLICREIYSDIRNSSQRFTSPPLSPTCFTQSLLPPPPPSRVFSLSLRGRYSDVLSRNWIFHRPLTGNIRCHSFNATYVTVNYVSCSKMTPLTTVPVDPVSLHFYFFALFPSRKYGNIPHVNPDTSAAVAN